MGQIVAGIPIDDGMDRRATMSADQWATQAVHHVPAVPVQADALAEIAKEATEGCGPEEGPKAGVGAGQLAQV